MQCWIRGSGCTDLALAEPRGPSCGCAAAGAFGKARRVLRAADVPGPAILCQPGRMGSQSRADDRSDQGRREPPDRSEGPFDDRPSAATERAIAADRGEAVVVRVSQ